MTAPPATVALPHIAFIAKAGSGKTTAAEYLAGHYGYTPLSFAGPLKDVAAEIWGNDARTDRDKLQKLGVAVREIDKDAWARLLVEHAKRIEMLGPTRESGIGPTRIVVDDCRFPNEAQMLAEAGFVFVRILAPERIRVDRLKANGKLQDESQLQHESETALDDWQSDHVITNDEAPYDFVEQLVKILNREQRRV